jgi:hypothetical protein
MKNQKLLNLLQADAVDYYLRQGHSIETARYMATYNHAEHIDKSLEDEWLAFENRQHAIHGLDPF